MESRAFIKLATSLISKIKEPTLLTATVEEDITHRSNIQKEINQLFSGLQNPTLPSAYNLRDTALRYNYQVDPRVLNRLSQLENVTG